MLKISEKWSTTDDQLCILGSQDFEYIQHNAKRSLDMAEVTLFFDVSWWVI